MSEKHVIRGTVGRPDLSAQNDPADVRRLNELLALAAAVCKESAFQPNSASDVIAAADSPTVLAMTALQKKLPPQTKDQPGLFTPDGESVAKLVGIERTRNPNLGDGPYFPYSASWTWLTWMGSQKQYAWRRKFNDGAARAHAACDLEAQQGRAIHAVKAGTVIGFHFFYWETWALAVDHGDFIIRYGEVDPRLEVENVLTGKLLTVGSEVQAGQKIARVGNLIKPGGKENAYDMLHLELYDKTASGSLDPPRKQSKHLKRVNDGKVCPTGRRTDLVDPSEPLLAWIKNRPLAY